VTAPRSWLDVNDRSMFLSRSGLPPVRQSCHLATLIVQGLLIPPGYPSKTAFISQYHGCHKKSWSFWKSVATAFKSQTPFLNRWVSVSKRCKRSRNYPSTNTQRQNRFPEAPFCLTVLSAKLRHTVDASCQAVKEGAQLDVLEERSDREK
jgi:hypothetical protein